MRELVIYAAYEHIAELMAEAEDNRRARGAKPKRSFRSFVASLFAGRQATPAPAAS